MASTVPSSPITTRAPEFQFTDRFVQPPGAVYIEPIDRLVIEATSAAPGTIFRTQLRILRPGEGIIEYRQEITIATARTPQVETFDLPEGFILGLDVSLPAAASGVAWNYVQVGLARGPSGTFDVFHGLAQGYVDVPYSLFWPGGIYRLPQDGVGLYVIVAGSDPAAGVEATITVPDNSQWLVHAMTTNLVTDATVADRRVLFRPTRSGVVMFEAAPEIVQPASLTFFYQVADWGTSGGNRNGRILVPWPARVRLQPGDVITTETINLQAGDNLGPLQVYAEEWFLRTA